MTPQDIARKLRVFRQEMNATANRIRRYSLDARLRVITPTGATPLPADPWADLRVRLDSAFAEWLVLRDDLTVLPATPTEPALNAVERKWLELDRKLDLIQRELISPTSHVWGIGTVVCLAVTLLGAVYAYLAAHGMPTFDVTGFDPWPEWGPVKYAEVACWSFFGVLCSLLYTASVFLLRRDFDRNFVTWYVSTALRAPFLVVILMMVVLEFVEWYGEGGWLETYILEEGNKYYFLAFMGFCLGIAGEATAEIIGDLTDGVIRVVRSAVLRVSERLGGAVSDLDTVT